MGPYFASRGRTDEDEDGRTELRILSSRIDGTFHPDALPQSGNFHITNKSVVVNNSLFSVRSVQIEEHRTHKPAFV